MSATNSYRILKKSLNASSKSTRDNPPHPSPGPLCPIHLYTATTHSRSFSKDLLRVAYVPLVVISFIRCFIFLAPCSQPPPPLRQPPYLPPLVTFSPPSRLVKSSHIFFFLFFLQKAFSLPFFSLSLFLSTSTLGPSPESSINSSFFIFTGE